MNLHTLIYGLHNQKITTIIYKLNIKCIRLISQNKLKSFYERYENVITMKLLILNTICFLKPAANL